MIYEYHLTDGSIYRSNKPNLGGTEVEVRDHCPCCTQRIYSYKTLDVKFCLIKEGELVSQGRYEDMEYAGDDD